MVVGYATTMNDEQQKIQDAKQLGEVISNVAHLTKALDKLDNTVHDFGDRLDKMALDINTLLGTQNSLVTLQKQANESTNWINEHKDFINSIQSDKKENKSRLKDFLFSYVVPHIITAVALYLLLQFKQQEAISQIINSMK